MTQHPLPAARPPFWLRFSVVTGTLVQLGGLVLGGALLAGAANLQVSDPLRVGLMILGWLVIYSCGHAIGHWAVGRLVGIRFRGYGLRGTDHPETYPPGLRQLMNSYPMFTVLTQTASMQAARPWARAAMFAAGETATTLTTLLAAGYAWQSGVPGGRILFIFTLIWDLVATFMTAVIPGGDYRKARHALQHG